MRVVLISCLMSAGAALGQEADRASRLLNEGGKPKLARPSTKPSRSKTETTGKQRSETVGREQASGALGGGTAFVPLPADSPLGIGGEIGAIDSGAGGSTPSANPVRPR